MGKKYAYDTYSDKDQSKHPDTRTFMDRIFGSKGIDLTQTVSKPELPKSTTKQDRLK